MSVEAIDTREAQDVKDKSSTISKQLVTWDNLTGTMSGGLSV